MFVDEHIISKTTVGKLMHVKQPACGHANQFAFCSNAQRLKCLGESIPRPG